MWWSGNSPILFLAKHQNPQSTGIQAPDQSFLPLKPFYPTEAPAWDTSTCCLRPYPVLSGTVCHKCYTLCILGPAAYMLPSVLGPKIVNRSSAPNYSMTGRSKIGSFHEDLQKVSSLIFLSIVIFLIFKLHFY